MSENIFEKALRLKVRFEYKGSIGVEDLWDLGLESLNSIYKSLSILARQANEDGLLNVRKVEDEILSLSTVSIFKDLPKDAWYKPYVNFAQSKGYVSGYIDANGQPLYLFGPEDNLTRAEAVKVTFLTKK